MADTTLPGVFLKGLASARPAANAVAGGTVYSATDTGVITQSDGVSTWSTWATISSGMTNPMSHAEAIIKGGTSGAPTELVIGADGKALMAVGGALVYAYPPGHEYDYVEKTSTTTVAATSEATADTILTGAAVTYDGSTVVMLEFYATFLQSPVNGAFPSIYLYDGSTSLGRWGAFYIDNAAHSLVNLYTPICLKRRLTPSAGSHTYSVRAAQSGTGSSLVSGSTAGSGNDQPTFLRITKA